MFCLKKKISTLIQYFSDLKRESDFKEKFNSIIIFLKNYTPESICTLMIIDIFYSFIKNKKWIESFLYKKILVDKIHIDYDLDYSICENIYDLFYKFFNKSIEENEDRENNKYNGDNKDNIVNINDNEITSNSLDYDFIKYICISILSMEDLDFDKDPDYVVNDLGLGSNIIKKVKDISLDFEKIINNSTTYFISDIDKMIFFVVEDISKMLVNNKYYIETQKLFYTIDPFFSGVDIDLDLNSCSEVFDFLFFLSKNDQIIFQKDDRLGFKDKYKIFSKLYEKNKLDAFLKFLIDKDIISRINAGMLIKYKLSSLGMRLVSNAFKDNFFEHDYSIDSILNLPVFYQIKVLCDLKDKNRSMFLEIMDKYLDKLNLATLESGIKQLFKIKEELNIKSEDLLKRISFLKSKNFKSLNQATYTRIHSILSEKD